MCWSVIMFCAAILAGLVKGTSTDVSQCVVSGGALPINTYIEGCTSPPCLLPQLQDAVFNIEFRAPHSIQSMKTFATAYLSLGPITISLPYDLEENAVTCNFLTNAACPVTEGQLLQYTLRMYIKPIFFVGTRVTVEFRVVDEENVPVVCIRLPIKIVPPVDV